MEEENFMPKDEETPESKTLNMIINGLDNLLRKTDSDYDKKIFFNVSYTLSGDYYKINIFPISDCFNSQKYFIKHFEKKKIQKRLAKFAEENNIGLVTY